MYCRLPYVSGGVLSLKTIVLYRYQSRSIIQYNQPLYTIYSSYMAPNQVPILEVFCCLQPRHPRGDRSRLHRGQRPCFTVNPIDLAAFVALASSCNSRLKVPTCQWWGLVVLRQEHVEHLKVADVCLDIKELSSVCGTLQLRGDVSLSDSTFNLFSNLTVCGAPAVTAGGC
jgi:hypothetical protein